MTKYYQWHLQAGVEKTVPFLVERSVLDERLPNYANATSIKFDTVPVPLNKLATATLVSTTNSSNKIYAYYTDDAQTQLVFAPKGEGVTIYAPVNCYRLFYNLTSVKQIDFSNFDTSNVTDMSYMFYYCRPLTSLDLSGFDTSNVTNTNNMFYYCRALTSLDLSGFDTSNVTDMNCMFYNCQALTSLDLSGFNTSNVTDMSYMFYYCQALTSLDLSGFDTSNVTNMSYMFRYCQALTSLDLSGFDTSNVTNMNNMFNYCRALTSFTVGNNFTMDNVVSYSGYLSNTGRDVPSYNSSYVYKSNGRRYSRTSKLPNGANTYYTYQR